MDGYIWSQGGSNCLSGNIFTNYAILQITNITTCYRQHFVSNTDAAGDINNIEMKFNQ